MRGSFEMPADPMQSVNFSPRKPATVAKLAGRGKRTGASGARLRGLRGGSRARRFAGGGKWEEMKYSLHPQRQKSRDGEQTNSQQVFTFASQPAKTLQNAK